MGDLCCLVVVLERKVALSSLFNMFAKGSDSSCDAIPTAFAFGAWFSNFNKKS